MLELPEANVMSRQLKSELLGDEITQVIVNQSPHKFAWYFENPHLYEARLQGLKLTDVVPISEIGRAHV